MSGQELLDFLQTLTPDQLQRPVLFEYTVLNDSGSDEQRDASIEKAVIMSDRIDLRD